MSTTEREPELAPEPIEDPIYCPLCGLERHAWPKTRERLRIELIHTCHGATARTVRHSTRDLSDDTWAPTPAGMVWYANWKREHPQAAAEVEKWAERAVDRAIAAKRARLAAQTVPTPPDAA